MFNDLISYKRCIYWQGINQGYYTFISNKIRLWKNKPQSQLTFYKNEYFTNMCHPQRLVMKINKHHYKSAQGSRERRV
jgi:hypothetical protein